MRKVRYYLLFVALCIVFFSGCNLLEKRVEFIVDNGIYYIYDTNGNEQVVMPEEPVKDGYIFDGWYFDNNIFKNKFDENSLLNKKLNENLRVYAKFITSHFSVNINLNNGTDPIIQNVMYGTRVSLPDITQQNAQYNSLEFDNWYTDIAFNNVFDANQPIYADLNIYAKWKLKFGYDSINVLSGSMTASGFVTGDKVVIDKLHNEEIKKGDKIAFYYPTQSLKDRSSLLLVDDITIKNSSEVVVVIDGDEKTIKRTKNPYFIAKETTTSTNAYFHLIENIYVDETDGIVYFETKGSSNICADSFLVREDLIVGKYYEKANNLEQCVGNQEKNNLREIINAYNINYICNISYNNRSITITNKNGLNDYKIFEYLLNNDSLSSTTIFTIELQNLSNYDINVFINMKHLQQDDYRISLIGDYFSNVQKNQIISGKLKIEILFLAKVIDLNDGILMITPSS